MAASFGSNGNFHHFHSQKCAFEAASFSSSDGNGAAQTSVFHLSLHIFLGASFGRSGSDSAAFSPFLIEKSNESSREIGGDATCS